MRELIKTGRTVDEATELACEELGLSREEVSVEILDLPAKKLFKFIPAKVKVTAVIEELSKEKNVLKKVPVEVQERFGANTQIQTEKPTQNNSIPSISAQQGIEINLEEDEKAKAACEYLIQICEKMSVKGAKINAEMRGEAIIIRVEGENVSTLIGRRGETMEALSYLCSLVANKQGGDYAKVGLDVSGYRSKREEGLTLLAQRIADKIIKTGRGQALEPMNPYERRIIHSAIGEIAGVKSESVGEGSYRRVVIMSATSTQNPEDIAKNERVFKSGGTRKPGYNNNKPHYNSDRTTRSPQTDKGVTRDKSSVPGRDFANRVRTNDAPIAPKRTETVNDGNEVPLYGKIVM